MDELAVNASNLNEELNTQHKMELTSVTDLEVCCIICIYVCIYLKGITCNVEM